MPTISLDRQDLFDALGRSYTRHELDALCFDYGLELDEWIEEPGERPTVKIEIPANRYDLLCLEGLTSALCTYLGIAEQPEYKVILPKDPITLIIEPEVASVRPYAASAILRGVTFDKRRYDSFIALQDKLHSNICRNRSLVAIGTHDLAKITGKNLRYRGMLPDEIKFVPLNQTKEFTGRQLVDHYKSDRYLGKFVPLIEKCERYPIFMDEANTVLSLPPIINSEHTKITLDTHDVFFDFTATDPNRLEVVVKEMVAMFAKYSSAPFTIEAVKIIYPDGSSRMCPDMTPHFMSAQVSRLNKVLGLSLKPGCYVDLLKKMGHKVIVADNETLEVLVPATRPDILHECDIANDAGVAYGFNNLEKTYPDSSPTIGSALRLNKLGDIYRTEAANCGWTEVMPLTLCSVEENFDWLRRKDDGTAVHIANPKTAEYQIVRSTLFPGILKTIRENRKQSLPIKVFECGDVVFKDTSLERQSFNARHFAAIFAGKSSNFEIVHGLMDRLLKALRCEFKGTGGRAYWLEATDDSMFFPQRGAKIMYRETKGSEPIVLGTIGVFHPEVLEKFELPFVCTGFEIDIQPTL